MNGGRAGWLRGDAEEVRLPVGPRRSLVRERDGRLLLVAQGLDSAAIGIAGVALPWFVLARGGSPSLAGVVFPLTIVPYVLFGLGAGWVGDRVHWRTVMATSHAIQAVAASVIPVWALLGGPPVGVALVAAFIIGSARVFADAGTFGAVASVVGPEEFLGGQSMLSAAWSVGAFAGPAAAGALVAVVGPARALACEATAFVLAMVLLLAVKARPMLRTVLETQERSALREGLRFIVRDEAVRIYTVISVAFGFATAGVYGLQVPLLRDAIGLSSNWVGWILAIGAVVGTVSALSVAPLDRRVGTETICAVGLVVSPLVIAVLSTASSAGVALLAFSGQAAVAWSISALVIGARQRRAPAELQARVGLSGRMLALGGVTAGAMLSSALTSVISVRAVYLVMACLAAVVAVIGISRIIRLHHAFGQPRDEVNGSSV